MLEDKRIFVETFALKFEEYDKVQKFVTTIAKPVTRSKYIQKYKIEKFTLYAAMALNKERDQILETLQKYNKYQSLPTSVTLFINDTFGCNENNGLFKTVLINGKYFLESGSNSQKSLNEIRAYINEEWTRQSYHERISRNWEVRMEGGVQVPVNLIVHESELETKFTLSSNRGSMSINLREEVGGVEVGSG